MSLSKNTSSEERKEKRDGRKKREKTSTETTPQISKRRRSLSKQRGRIQIQVAENGRESWGDRTMYKGAKQKPRTTHDHDDYHHNHHH